ncbi:MAG: alanine--tRNA ligase [Candidatus Vogelbacteria bacterium]|nr:alanine--tRNA ligase [Candidatus Vogelbacteria bacterium]
MNSREIRQKYLDFFRKRGHAVIHSAPIIPENDPTTLFTSSGMQPLVPYLLGQPHPLGKRLVNSQKSFRAEDIEEVGDNRHTTFFEMLGNWSLGDYFKQEQLPWFFDYLTKVVGLNPNRIYVSAFSGDHELGIGRDDESIKIWQEIFGRENMDAKVVEIITEENGGDNGMQGGRIFTYNANKNWWSRSGTPDKMPVGEIGGPDSELFYEFTHIEHNAKFGKHCHPNCDCGRFIEIGNSVFIQYKKTVNGFDELPQRNVDFGGGLERITAASENRADVFQTDLFLPTIHEIERVSGKKYEENAYAMRVIADHLRGVIFMASAGIQASNTDQGYILRRLLRRAVRYADTLSLPNGALHLLVTTSIRPFENVYNELSEKHGAIQHLIQEEEAKFRTTLARGMKHFEELTGDTISGQDAFVLFTTYGFPIEVTQELAKEKRMTVDLLAYETAMKNHQALSRAGAEQKFKGGLADNSEATVRYHTAHHLLLKALQIVLGPNVHQRGSNITAERLRIDFVSPHKMTDDEKRQIEEIVNNKIKECLPVSSTVMKKEEAETYGAEHEFNADYPEMVSVYSVGPKDATPENPKIKDAFSVEFCGGPHVKNTKELNGTFKIIKEEAVAAGIRRIKAVIE